MLNANNTKIIHVKPYNSNTDNQSVIKIEGLEQDPKDNLNSSVGLELEKEGCIDLKKYTLLFAFPEIINAKLGFKITQNEETNNVDQTVETFIPEEQRALAQTLNAKIKEAWGLIECKLQTEKGITNANLQEISEKVGIDICPIKKDDLPKIKSAADNISYIPNLGKFNINDISKGRRVWNNLCYFTIGSDGSFKDTAIKSLRIIVPAVMGGVMSWASGKGLETVSSIPNLKSNNTYMNF